MPHLPQFALLCLTLVALSYDIMIQYCCGSLKDTTESTSQLIKCNYENVNAMKVNMFWHLQHKLWYMSCHCQCTMIWIRPFQLCSDLIHKFLTTCSVDMSSSPNAGWACGIWWQRWSYATFGPPWTDSCCNIDDDEYFATFRFIVLVATF